MVVADEPKVLSWDTFLPEGEILRRAIDAFRHTGWGVIKRQLTLEFPDVELEAEPHWFSIGKAVYWQEQFTTQMRSVVARDGRPQRITSQESTGWKPTNPLPAGSASLMAGYLRKGLRLRPPSEAGYVEALESAFPPEGSQIEPEGPPKFACNRHAKGKTAFRTWRGYIQHCADNSEAPENIPDEVVEKRKIWAYYCMLHDRGFNHYRLAARHVTSELKKTGKVSHPTAASMEVKDADSDNHPPR